MAKQNIILKDILYWIVDNCDDTDAMEKINKATFPFTSRYAKYAKSTKPIEPKLPSVDIEDIDLSSWGDV